MPEVRVLDHGYLKLVTSWGGDQEIVEAARMSTQKGFEGWGEDRWCCKLCKCLWRQNPDGSWSLFNTEQKPCRECDNGAHFVGIIAPVPGDEKLLRYLWDHEHHTPFEMAGATFEVQAPIFVFREWHRHRVPFGYNEASARYAPLPDLNYVPTVERMLMGGGHLTKQAGSHGGAPPLTAENAAKNIEALKQLYANAEEMYRISLSLGVPKELARIVLPVGRYSRMRATSNLRGWLGFLKLRQAPQAQYEIRVYANAVHDELAALFPRTLALFDGGRK